MKGNEFWAIFFLLLGAFLMFLEFVLPANFVLFAFGLGFLAMAGLTYLKAHLLIQVLAFAIVVSMTVFLAYKFSKRSTEGVKDFSPLSVVGKEGKVVLIEGDKLIVRVDGEDWLAEGEGDLKLGDVVVVLEVLGNKLRVKRG